MAIYKLDNENIIELQNTTFANEKIDERNDLQKYFLNSINVIEPDLFVIANEFNDWLDSRRSIDILCIDKDANLVVIELKKTEDGGHMELQSIRYAAMISNMTFAKAVRSFKKHVEKHNLGIENPEEEILHFLEWDEPREEQFGQDIRIILVSANFSKEITTSVLWLNERDLDIKCIRVKPQRDNETLYFDIQQIVPLPETQDYQIKIREKVSEERQSRRDSSFRDFSKYNVVLNGIEEKNLSKRRAMFFVISNVLESGIKPEELFEITKSNKWIWVEKVCNTRFEFENEEIKNRKKYDSSRWFVEDNELFVVGERTYAFSNQHSKEAFNLISGIFEKFPELYGTIKVND